MIKLLFSLIVFAVLFIIGCQGNSITDTAAIEATNKSQNLDRITSGDTIHLEGILVHHDCFNSCYSIEGSINYTHKLILFDTKPPSPQMKSTDLTNLCS